MEPKELATRVWPGQEVSIEPLGGGITNRNYKVTTNEGEFVLRIGGKDTELLGIDRNAERAASETAADLGLAPPVVGYVEPEGYLVTKFVEGEVGKPDVARAAASLRRLHDGPVLPSRFDSFRVVETYREIAEANGVEVPEAFTGARDIANCIERKRAGAPVLPCHNDLLSANFIDDGDRLWIVDWEYAGMGDPFFDLGNFAVNNGLDEEGERALLAAYGSDDGDALVLMRFMSDFREAMWGVVQTAISELDFDFPAYAQEHFERLARTAVERRFLVSLH